MIWMWTTGGGEAQSDWSTRLPAEALSETRVGCVLEQQFGSPSRSNRSDSHHQPEASHNRCRFAKAVAERAMAQPATATDVMDNRRKEARLQGYEGDLALNARTSRWSEMGPV